MLRDSGWGQGFPRRTSMILSHKHRFIFVKSKKTAGTSLEIALSRLCGPDDIITPSDSEDEALQEQWGGRGAQNHRKPILKFQWADWHSLLTERCWPQYQSHMTPCEIRRAFGETVWREYRTLCFERNPWDRAVSSYYWRVRSMESPPTLEQFVRSHRDSVSNSKYYLDESGPCVDHVARFEQLEAEVDALSAWLGVAEPIRLPTAKAWTRPPGRHYRDLIGPELRDYIGQLCAREIALLGYTF